MLELFPELYQETLRLFAAMACGEMAAGDAPVQSTLSDSPSFGSLVPAQPFTSPQTSSLQMWPHSALLTFLTASMKSSWRSK